jgi:hypothetical protein
MRGAGLVLGEEALGVVVVCPLVLLVGGGLVAVLLWVGVLGEVYFEAFELDAGRGEAAEDVGEGVLDLDAGLWAGDFDTGSDTVVGLLELD